MRGANPRASRNHKRLLTEIVISTDYLFGNDSMVLRLQKIPRRIRVPNPNFFILYVDNPAASSAFYSRLFGRSPVESSPTFAMFALDSGVMIGLWSKHTVQPSAICAGGGGEWAFAVEGKHAADALCAEWKTSGLPIVQDPLDMEFGYTFVALDPDGHRLRVFVPHNDDAQTSS